MILQFQRVSSPGMDQMGGRTGSLTRLQTRCQLGRPSSEGLSGAGGFFPVQLTNSYIGCLEASFSFHMDFSIELEEYFLWSEQSKREQHRSYNVLQDLSSEVTYHHCWQSGTAVEQKHLHSHISINLVCTILSLGTLLAQA